MAALRPAGVTNQSYRFPFSDPPTTVEGLIDLAAKASGAAAQSKYREALAEAERFRDFDSSSFSARYLVGRAALGAGEFDKAIAAFQDVLPGVKTRRSRGTPRAVVAGGKLLDVPDRGM